ncbi:hypothetical protein ACR24L_004597, partial [Salmonella enterica subsp. enterica serovar Montevideo]
IAPAITPYSEKKTQQNEDNHQDENTEKNHLKKNENTYAGRESKPPISHTEIVSLWSVIRRKICTSTGEKNSRDITVDKSFSREIYK